MVRCSAVTLFRKRYKGLMRPMVLKPTVRLSRKTAANPPCLGEMAAVMACWKLHNFEDMPCKKEIAAFTTCAEEVRTNPQSQTDKSGYKWTPEDVNNQLRKFTRPQ